MCGPSSRFLSFQPPSSPFNREIGLFISSKIVRRGSNLRYPSRRTRCKPVQFEYNEYKETRELAKRRESNWADLLKQVEVNDGLPTREAGPWTFDKLWWWNRYIEITTVAMVGKPHWSELVYVDLFAGPGICESRTEGTRIPGSPLIAALAPKEFGRLLLCEADDKLANACETRLLQFGAANRATVFHGNCNQQIDDICAAIPDRAL